MGWNQKLGATWDASIVKLLPTPHQSVWVNASKVRSYEVGSCHKGQGFPYDLSGMGRRSALVRLPCYQGNIRTSLWNRRLLERSQLKTRAFQLCFFNEPMLLQRENLAKVFLIGTENKLRAVLLSSAHGQDSSLPVVTGNKALTFSDQWQNIPRVP